MTCAEEWAAWREEYAADARAETHRGVFDEGALVCADCGAPEDEWRDATCNFA